MPSTLTMGSCNICGGEEFAAAPNNRLSRRGLPPVCVKCRSLERHRIGRKIMSEVRERTKFSQMNLLQFSNDPIVAREWFASTEVSVYGESNSIDIQDIDRPDESYGFIVCSHILEHVADPRGAVQELVRILKKDGLMFLAYPTPRTRAVTEDWGYPKASQHGHYRLFGRDFEAEYRRLVPDCYVVAAQGVDDVTGDDDIVYLVTKDFFWVRRALAATFSCRLLTIPADTSAAV